MTFRSSRFLALLATFGLVLPAGCRCASRALPGTSGTTGASGGTSTTGASTATASAGTTAPPPDVANGCHPELYGECDPWCQDCPEGQKCVAWASDGGDSWDATRCSPLAPSPKAPGEPCTTPEGPTAGLDDCDKGSICFNVDPGTGIGVCVAMCRGAPDDPVCGDLSTYCEIFNDGVLPLCYQWCHPITQAGCSSEDICVLLNVDLTGPPADTPPFDPAMVVFACVLDAGPQAPQATPCQYINACNPGLACVDATLVPNCDPNAAPGCCARWCDLSQPDCPEGGTCQPVLEPTPDLPQEFANLGLCLLP